MSQISGLCCDPPKQPLKAFPPLCFHALLPREFGKPKWAETPARLRFFLETYGTELPAEPGGFGNKKWGSLPRALVKVGSGVLLDPGGSWGIQGGHLKPIVAP